MSVRFVQFTDGAWDGESATEDMPSLTAGWGAAEFECVQEGTPDAMPMGQMLAEHASGGATGLTRTTVRMCAREPAYAAQRGPVACRRHTPLHTPLLPGICVR